MLVTDLIDTPRDAVLEELPPSAKYVVFVLEGEDGSVTRCELQKRTDLPDRTLDRALDRLEAADVIRRDRTSDDLRFVRVEFDETS
ncbi:MarR family transcriptional regulator [Natrinema sp. CBA1119]|uniref:MarR family transcriptional regulator n=1 Tax=Natrinema sp. CBA1119 TaxID=1608465 RepID=UPI000BF6393F|nr:MarR family transcriptional regulator [Natrinema sp. CBA1119]PGF16169.1 MarR family transcriptional regulator [Natrinema sp. CBA1119]